MTKAELLAELNLILDGSVSSCGSDALCPPAQKTKWLSEGQDKFCEDTGLFVDITNTAFQVTLVVGQRDYILDDRIIKVLEVWDDTRFVPPLERPFRSDMSSLLVGEGAPQAWLCDREPGKITLYPAPTEVKTLQMKVWRYPMTPLTDGEPELPSRLQRACVEWAAYKVLLMHDAELRNKAKAVEHLSNYQQYVADGIKYLKRLRGVDLQFGCDPIYLGA